MQVLPLFTSDAQAFSNAFYGQGSGPIYLDSVQCSGTELDLFDCPSDNTPSCTQSDAAGARCNPTGMDVTLSGLQTFGMEVQQLS